MIGTKKAEKGGMERKRKALSASFSLLELLRESDLHFSFA